MTNYRDVQNYSCMFESSWFGVLPATPLSLGLPICHFLKDWRKLLQLSRNIFTQLCRYYHNTTWARYVEENASTEHVDNYHFAKTSLRVINFWVIFMGSI